MYLKKNDLIYCLPFVGILVFGALYFYSATLYPGGSQVDANAIGFDWVNNYWCNLTSKNALNGDHNPARPVAIFAMITLCSSLLVFFIQFAKTFIRNKHWKQFVIMCSSLSMFSAALIFTALHDAMTILSSLFGMFVMFAMIKALYKSNLRFYKITGVLCILLLALNNYIYYSRQYIELLPLLQKITFAIVLVWILSLNRKMKTFR